MIGGEVNHVAATASKEAVNHVRAVLTEGRVNHVRIGRNGRANHVKGVATGICGIMTNVMKTAAIHAAGDGTDQKIDVMMTGMTSVGGIMAEISSPSLVVGRMNGTTILGMKRIRQCDSKERPVTRT